VNGQGGLEKIIVEKYYISDVNDAAASAGGYLPAGSTTYRIYVDLLPGYKFQAAYGVPGHELRIATTTSFFNNVDKGAAIANDIPNSALRHNTVMLDSWLSVGAASEGNYGILKSDDDTSSTVVNANEPKVMQNDNPLAGIPVKIRDGLKAATPQLAVTVFGLDSELSVFKNQVSGNNRNVFSTFNGSWASFGGAVGPTPDNRVLIAQVTTDGVLSFELNIQLGTPFNGVENYVAKNPVGNEIQSATLTYPASSQVQKMVTIKPKSKSK
jgi:hypothetical protein